MAAPEQRQWIERWTIHSTHPARTQHPPAPDCTNCDGRGCMACVTRKEHDHCEDDCPVCCSDNFESAPVEVIRYEDHALEVGDLRIELDLMERDRDAVQAHLTQLQEGERLRSVHVDDDPAELAPSTADRLEALLNKAGD